MGKSVLKIAAIAGFAALTFIPGVGQALQGAIVAGLGGSFAALGVASAIVSIATVALTVGALSAIQGLMKPKVPSATLSRLNLSFDPNATRKTVFGRNTAMGTDVIYQEISGADQEYVDYIIVCAAHRVHAITEIRTEDNILWNGSVVGKYAGYATVDVRLEGTAGNAIPINGGTTWTSGCRMTGCAYIHLRIKRIGNSKKAESPFASGLAGRMTIIGDGMPVYDPRRDSTRGGSGAHRADNQATWECVSGGVDLGSNTALQSLASLIGWKIGGVVSVGGGMPIARIDFADFITAANICDEAVALAAGGTHRRYETAGMFGDENDTADVLSTLCGHMDAEMRDVNGKVGIRIGVNDLAGGLPLFTADDILGAYEYNGFATLTDSPNIVRGRFTDPSTASLYQLAPYSKISVTSVDGIDRSETLDLALCQNAERAQRLATRLLLRLQFQSVLTVDLGPRAWALRPGSPLTVTFAPLGLVNQKFRIVSQSLKVVLSDDGAQQFCAVTMRADDPAIYAYTPGTVALPAAAIPAVNYNVLNNPLAITSGVDIGVSNNATAGGNLIISPNFEGGDTSGWVVPGDYALEVPQSDDWAVSQSGTTGNTLETESHLLATGAIMFAEISVITGTGGANNPNGPFYWTVNSTLPDGTGDTVEFSEEVPYPYLSVYIRKAQVGPFTTPRLIRMTTTRYLRTAGKYYITFGYLGITANGADTTSLNVPSLSVPPTITVNANSAGTINSGELPRTAQAVRRKGTVDVSSSTTWAISPVGCAATVDANGLATITNVTSGSGKILWTSTRDAVVLTAETAVAKLNASPPVTSGGGGGGGVPGGPATDPTITSTASTSYGAANSDILSVVVGSSGTVNLTAPLDFQGSNPAGATLCYGKWQWRITGGTFADVAVETLTSTAWDGVNAFSGYIQVNETKTGLTSGSAYEFQLLMRKGTGVGTISFRNSATASPA